MPPRKLTVEEQDFLDYWVQKAIYFSKNVRRADRYLQTIPRERYLAAYNEFTSSGHVVGGHWDNLDQNDRRRWEPKPEERDDYFKYVEGLVKNHPPTSPINAVTTIFAGNSAVMCIGNLIAMERPGRVQDMYWVEFCRLNKEDINAVYGSPETRSGITKDVVVRDPDEEPSNKPFVRSRPQPQNSVHKISPSEWKQFEHVGDTYFVRDGDDQAGFTAFELTGILLLRTGRFYEIRYENMVDSIRISEGELMDILDDGVWV